MPSTVPRDLHTARLWLRPWRAEDARALLPVLEANQAHIGPWIPTRISTPAPIPELQQRLAEHEADFDADQQWRYAIHTLDGADVLGEVALFPRDAMGRAHFAQADRAEIGYWLREDWTGRGLATEAARAMMDVARTLPRLLHLEIRCDERNAPSAAVPLRLAFTLATTIEEPDGRLQVWTRALATSDRTTFFISPNT
jgi:RimJ/RimL family protein N-acetyltransferase